MQSRIGAAVGTIIFVLFIPGSVILLVPWLLSGWQQQDPLFGWIALRWVGIGLLAIGLPILVEPIARFVWLGRGTPAPLMPTEEVVVTGLYRFVRNPMYIGVLAMIVGQGLFFGSAAVLVYAAIMAVAFHTFVRLYEEPTLTRRYGTRYDAYCRGVPRWVPRLTPWQADQAADVS